MLVFRHLASPILVVAYWGAFKSTSWEQVSSDSFRLGARSDASTSLGHLSSTFSPEKPSLSPTCQWLDFLN
jgi:hypothetical protein